jgi:hypothetical protein
LFVPKKIKLLYCSKFVAIAFKEGFTAKAKDYKPITYKLVALKTLI